MLRKLSLAAVAAVALGAALAPTSASAHWHGGGWGWQGGGGGWHRGGYGWGGPRFYAPVSYGSGGCYARRLVPTPWGPRWRMINRCY